LSSGDKEKEKEKDRDKDRDRDRERPNDEGEPSDPHLFHERRAPKSDLGDEPVPHTHGWTSILEDFFVHGLAVVGPGARARGDRSSHPELGRAPSVGDIRRRPRTGTKGPYEMLVKERLMGIYLAVFVHRDAKHLVRGVSLFFFHFAGRNLC
jgi:hypothetical protein